MIFKDVPGGTEVYVEVGTPDYKPGKDGEAPVGPSWISHS